MSKRRSRGEGSLYFLESKGLWVSKITLPDGSRRVKYGKTQKEVRHHHQTILNQLQQGILAKNDTITISTFLKQYMDNVGKHTLRPKTIEVYSYLIRLHVNPAIGHIRLVQLRPDHLQSLYSKKLESGLSKRTVQFIHSVIRKALNQAFKWGLVPRNVASLVEAPRPNKRPPAVWTPEEVNIFLKSAKDHKYFLIFQLALYCGFREGEVLGIHVEDCDLQKGIIKVVHTVQTLKGGLVIAEPKTKSSRRSVTVSESALATLRNHISLLNKNQGLIFTTSKEKPISPSNLVKEFKAAIEKAGLPKIRFHDLRHTSATLLLSAGVHPKVVQERLGHSQISMTMDLYTHVLPTLQEEAAVKIEEILSHP